MSYRKTLLAAVLLALAVAPAIAASAQDDVEIEKLTDRLRIKIGGELFTEYVYTYSTRPYFYPILGPGHAPMTRNWPMKEANGEEQDHPHHRSLWYAHGDVNGVDFWTEAKGTGSIVHRGFDEVSTREGIGTIIARNDWVDKTGKLICKDLRTMRVSTSKLTTGTRILDFEVAITASEGDLIFGDTKEGTMAIRLAETMRLKGQFATGRIVNSAGNRDDATWGKRANWCDYYGQVAGKTVGVAIFDHPKNPRHPTWWHVRDYGLFAANPFGKHDFEKLPQKDAGSLAVKKGETITFKYRFLFHEGTQTEAKVPEEYESYAQETK